MSTPKDKQPHPTTMLSVDFQEANAVVGLIDAAYRGMGVKAKTLGLDPLLEKFDAHGVALAAAGLGPKEEKPPTKKRAAKKKRPALKSAKK